MYPHTFAGWIVVVSVTTVSAQSSSTLGTCCEIDPNSLDSSTRSSYCSANLQTCSTLCGSASTNQCSPDTLEYSCKCGNGNQPDMSTYKETVPSLMCNAWITQCITKANGDTRAENLCKAQTCGTEEAALLGSTSSTRSSGAASEITTSPGRSTTPPSTTDTPLSQSQSTPPTTQSSPSSSPTGSGSANTGRPDDATQPSLGKAKLSTGAIVGIVVGVIGGVIAIAALCLCCRRAQKAREGNTQDDKKGLSIPTVLEIPDRAELDSNALKELSSDTRPSELPGAKHTSTAELQSSPYQAPSELYSAKNYQHQYPRELDAPISYNRTATQPPPTTQQETGSSSPPTAPVQLAYRDGPPGTPKSQDLYSSPVLTERSIQGLSAEEIATLQEEERRIDAEMEEVKRMRELREQKLAIQQKLLNARAGT